MTDKERAAIQNASNQARRKEWFSANGPCAKCGTTENLELHHREKETKLTHKIWSYRSEMRDMELAKCIVLCDKCHNRLHADEKIVHGTRTRYKKGCRCQECVDFWMRFKETARTQRKAASSVN